MIKINIIPRLKYYFTLCAFISFASTADSIRIASGSSNGVYYPVALKICELINNNNSIVACEVIETSGSVTNLELLKTGKADFAVIQSDAALDSFQGKGIFFGDKPFEDMRFVLSLFDEYLTLITKNESGIVLFGDLNGKKIGANLNGTGVKTVLLTLFKNYSFISGPAMMNIPESQMAAKVCNSEIDALAIITAHPSLLVNSIFNLCNIDFISIDLLRLDGIVQSNNIYSQGIIDPSLYNKTSHSSNTLVMKSVLVTSAQVPYDKINILQNTLRLQFDAFVASHPALKSLDKTKVFDQNQYIIPSYY